MSRCSLIREGTFDLSRPVKPTAEVVRSQFVLRENQGTEDRTFVTALARGLDVVRAFGTKPGPLGNSELSSITGLSKATVSRLTYTLVQLGYLDRVGTGRKYKLNVSLLSLAYPALSSQPARQPIHAKMMEIARQTQCNIALAAPSADNTSMIYTDCANGSSANTLQIDIGTRLVMAKSSVGRAFLAGLDNKTRELCFSKLAAYHGAEWKELEPRVTEAIQEVNERGYCLVDGEWMTDSRGVAAPIIWSQGNQKTVWALSYGAASFAVTVDRLEQELGPQLVHVARSIESMLPTLHEG